MYCKPADELKDKTTLLGSAVGSRTIGLFSLLFLLCFAELACCSGAFADSFNEIDPQDFIQTLFTPYDDGLAAYLSFLDRAHKSVYVAGYSFAEKGIVDKLVELKTGRNVEVHILLDYSQTQGRSANSEVALINTMRQAGIEVIVGSSEKSHQLMHDKYTLIDDLWVESGSWNYTRSANKQDNEIDFIKSVKRAKLFRANWDRMYAVMKSQQVLRDEQNFFRTAMFAVVTGGIFCLVIGSILLLRRIRGRKGNSK